MSTPRLPVNPGSIVRHKMGGPKMVVYGTWHSETYNRDYYCCRWWDAEYEKFRREDFTRDELQRLG